MDVKKTSKEEAQVLDINDIMNRLINKISLVVQDEEPAQRKDLIEIRDIFSELIDIDKTLTYNILPETVINIRKAIQSIRVTDPEKLKELNEIVQPFKTFEKLDENDIPTSEADKRNKFNEIINTQLQQTIKTINDVIMIVDANEKANIKVPKGELGVDKIVTEIFVSLLADRLKAINEIFLPEDTESKNIEEIELNAERINKNTRTAYSDTQRRLKEFIGIDISDQESNKESPTAFEKTEVEEKQVQRIGTFPDLRFKSQQLIDDAAESVEKVTSIIPDEQVGDEKELREIQDADVPDDQNGLLKSDVEIQNASDSVAKEFDPFTEEVEVPDQENVKASQNIQQADEGDEKTLNELIQATTTQKERYDFDNTTTFRKGQEHSQQERFEYIPKPSFQTDQGADEFTSDINPDLLIKNTDGDTQKSRQEINIVGRGDAKASRGDEWYEQLFSPAGNEVGVFANGVGVSYDPINQSAQAVGAALAFFSLNTADITRYVNKGLRNINTSANSIAITSELLLIQSQRSSGVTPEGELYKSVNADANLDTDNAIYDAATYKQENNKQLAREENEEAIEQIISGYKQENNKQLAMEENEEAIEQIISEYEIKDKPLQTGAEPIDDLAEIIKETIEKRDKYEKVKVNVPTFPMPENDDDYKNRFKERTEEITINGKKRKASGFIKVFNKRSPRFEQGDEENQILPFQFEPVITGDSKGAEYSGVSMIGRSQSAQVYKKSNERNITLELKYIVTGPPMDAKATNTTISRSAKGLELWDEEYIYAYIVRNFRNLTLPNYKKNSYRLAPPIVQVWYGGIGNGGASTGVTDKDNSKLNDSFPVFRTNWYSADYGNQSFRSLWICKSVGFDYQGGIINRITKNRVMVNVQLQLTEIAPAVNDNEVYLWNTLIDGD